MDPSSALLVTVVNSWVPHRHVIGLWQGQLLEEEALADVPTLVYANKQDLLNAMSVA